MPPCPHNDLDSAKSPYLLQHADNPVHWYRWGEEAFRAAREQDKPVFLSIGYATCHWCHVMAHESFEDEEVARLMNETFINIKVDREERPDIDNTYMHVCQMLTGRGGWPLTIVMTPEKKPFYAATYIPKRGRQGRPGLMELVPRLAHLWNEEREKIRDSAEEIGQAFQQSIEPVPATELPDGILDQTVSQLHQQFDSEHGGFGGAPKFPTPHTLTFLLRYARYFGREKAKAMAVQTLTSMRRGGLFDQVGGGFHRYSTDTRWLLPHFEKMLYDQAMHLMAYTEGFQATGTPLFRDTAHRLAGYLLRDLRHPGGAFYSAEDADSEGEEGTFYVWSLTEIREHLPTADAELAIEIFNIREEGNYADESTGQTTGKNILHRTQSIAELAAERDLSEQQLHRKLESIRTRLFEIREQRPRPFLDDKILTDWNGLAIAALARAGRFLDETSYVEAAEAAAAFILDHLYSNDELLHRYRDGEAAIGATADDYAFLAWGLIELYESTFKTGYLQQAVTLQQQMNDRCWDEANGAFFFTGTESEELLGRKKEFYDSALPSGNSIAALNLLRLGRITARPDWEEQAGAILAAASSMVSRAPTSFTQLMQAHLRTARPASEVVIAGPLTAGDTQRMISITNQVYAPHNVVILNDPADDAIAELAPYLRQQTPQDGHATAYVCQNYSCNRPTNDPQELKKQLMDPLDGDQ